MTHGDDAPTDTILYVEDNPTNQRLMQAVVSQRPGVRLVIAPLGADALRAAADERPALICLDRHLPDMSGGELLRLLRARQETQSIPVIIVSGDTAAPGDDEATLGVIAYLTKPFDIHELLSHIDNACSTHPG